MTKHVFHVNVTSGKGDTAVNAALNTWPQVGNLSASATALEVNESTTVSATASNNDGDTLAYSWAASCPGTWSAPSPLGTSPSGEPEGSALSTATASRAALQGAARPPIARKRS
ncbi:hypothetical protein ATI61_108230 [Archangium gephyra]|uniref:Branched-chain amino acid ABC transporter, amino acid-binding protein n=1 Tax=Archangium gephyra TaxID=48 RepID=A0AAC8TE17_9BACT|nr:hypothetical protein [Archangium gephyra]AKJ02383.1 Branched-chain amino acid ABC transporter, amino acid-binding protein [Archangium gephyra]REG28690.1 hypothetical protein ATI61_108230 [Archangium gephyra]